MSSEKATAIILRTYDFSESSLVVTLFSREFGKVRALAKGAKRPKGSFESALDLLCLCRIVFLLKSSDTLDLLTEAKLLRRFRPPGHDLTSLYAGYYIAELIEVLTDDRDPHPELFDVANNTLQALSDSGPVASLVLRFELTALRVLGHLPSLDVCVESGEPIDFTRRIYFGLIDGGVLTEQHRIGRKNVVSVSPEVIRVLQKFSRRDEETWRTEELPRNIHGELRALLNQYLYHLVGHKLKMHEYLRFVCT